MPIKLQKTWVTILLLCFCAAIPYSSPRLERLRIFELHKLYLTLAAWRPGALGRIILRREHGITLAPPPASLPGTAAANDSHAAEPESKSIASPLPPSLSASSYLGKDWPVREDLVRILEEPAGGPAIEDYGCVMSHFYGALAHTEKKEPGAITRISHFGDSPISGDLISGDARRLLQEKFGDAGHGWIFVTRPWDFYYHEGVVLEGEGWKVSSPVLPNGHAGAYGLGGARFTSDAPSSFSSIRTTKKGIGSAVGRFDIFFRIQPNSGSFLVSVDRAAPVEIPTRAATKGSDMRSIVVPDGGHSLKLTPKGNGPVTLYGVVLERDTPGVVYDTLGALGATIHHLTLFDEDSWIEDLRNRKPDLVIFNFGTNESNYGYLAYKNYMQDYSDVVQRVKRAIPEAAILIMAPMDRGARDEDGNTVTLPSIPVLVAAQRRVARAESVAFFNTFSAMGGMGTMGRWYANRPRLVTGDLTHPTGLGAQELGALLVDALLQGYAAYNRNKDAQPCVPLPNPGSER